MINYSKGTTEYKPRGKPKIKSILEIKFDELILYIFPGNLSLNDILIKFNDTSLSGTRIRQPSHIHWVVDLLIKKEKNPRLTDEFLKLMLERWDGIRPLKNRDIKSIKNKLVISRDEGLINKFLELDGLGFFPLRFIIHLMELLMIQEKTNFPSAYRFKEVVEALLKGDDLYTIISKAIHKNR